MPDIFISYTREDQERIETLVQVLETQGWSVFWDRRIPAGQTWHSHIGKALAEARCVIVGWSSYSVLSNWVIEEADEGKRRGVLLPILLDSVEPPFGFRSIQAADMTSWDRSPESPILVKLLADVNRVLMGPSVLNAAVDSASSAPTSRIPAKRPFSNALVSRRLFNTWRFCGAIVLLFLLVSAGFFIHYQLREGSNTSFGPKEATGTVTAVADIFYHEHDFTFADAQALQVALAKRGIPSRIFEHRDPTTPDAVFIGALVGANETRIVLSLIPYEINYIFRPDYPEEEGGDPGGHLIGIGYMSTHYKEFRGKLSEPIRISPNGLKYLTEPGISNAEFQKRLRQLTKF